MKINSEAKDILKAVVAGSSIYIIGVAVYVIGFNILFELDEKSILSECPAIDSCGAGLIQVLWFLAFFFLSGLIAIKLKKINAMLTFMCFIFVSVCVDTYAYGFLIWNMQDHRFHLLLVMAMIAFCWDKHLKEIAVKSK